jgi:hypothetical protein
MKPNVYNLYGVDVQEAFKRIDSFLNDNRNDTTDNSQLPNVDDIVTIKLLISDLIALEGLEPKELKKREKLLFKLISMLSIYYLSQKDEINVKNFFLIPEKA